MGTALGVLTVLTLVLLIGAWIMKSGPKIPGAGKKGKASLNEMRKKFVEIIEEWNKSAYFAPIVITLVLYIIVLIILFFPFTSEVKVWMTSWLFWIVLFVLVVDTYLFTYHKEHKGNKYAWNAGVIITLVTLLSVPAYIWKNWEVYKLEIAYYNQEEKRDQKEEVAEIQKDSTTAPPMTPAQIAEEALAEADRKHAAELTAMRVQMQDQMKKDREELERKIAAAQLATKLPPNNVPVFGATGVTPGNVPQAPVPPKLADLSREVLWDTTAFGDDFNKIQENTTVELPVGEWYQIPVSKLLYGPLLKNWSKKAHYKFTFGVTGEDVAYEWKLDGVTERSGKYPPRLGSKSLEEMGDFALLEIRVTASRTTPKIWWYFHQ